MFLRVEIGADAAFDRELITTTRPRPLPPARTRWLGRSTPDYTGSAAGASLLKPPAVTRGQML